MLLFQLGDRRFRDFAQEVEDGISKSGPRCTPGRGLGAFGGAAVIRQADENNAR